jgi:hypothetical protein
VADSDHSWDWLNRATQEARELINRLYWEGRNQLVDPVAERPPKGDGWPGDTDHRA